MALVSLLSIFLKKDLKYKYKKKMDQSTVPLVGKPTFFPSKKSKITLRDSVLLTSWEKWKRYLSFSFHFILTNNFALLSFGKKNRYRIFPWKIVADLLLAILVVIQAVMFVEQVRGHFSFFHNRKFSHSFSFAPVNNKVDRFLLPLSSVTFTDFSWRGLHPTVQLRPSSSGSHLYSGHLLLYRE